MKGNYDEGMNKVSANVMKDLIKSIYKKVIFPSSKDYLTLLRKELQNCTTVLDLGCSRNSPIQFCSVPYSVGVELFEPYLEESKRKGIHNQYIKADIRKLSFKQNSFDAVLALDVLEHLSNEESYELIEKMEEWAKKKVIIFTPNGFVWQNGYDNNPLQIHKSGGSVSELKNIGFKVYGINGYKILRGYNAEIKFKPRLFWMIISDFTQKFTYLFSKYAFQLFCVKTIGDE
jgi:hypothetical protein